MVYFINDKLNLRLSLNITQFIVVFFITSFTVNYYDKENDLKVEKDKYVASFTFFLACFPSYIVRCWWEDICRKLWPTSSGASGMLNE